MEENNYYRQDLFNLILEDFLKYSPGVTAVALVTGDGFPLASAGNTTEINNLDALSSIALDVIKRVMVNSSFRANEVMIGDNENNRIICRYFTHDAATSGDYVLVLYCENEYKSDKVNLLLGKLEEALQAFY